MFDFERLFSFDSYLLNSSSDFTKTVIFQSCKPDLSDCEMVISVARLHIERTRTLQSLITFPLIHHV